ncbi:hypothetical protein [Catenuloplanes indicus]|uniref:Uncharacterized protein n=1 Tax=Catenuloplanes indicus TaxID=137267 RepID=A0AAE3VYU1_9ACTN|nr:hypothetical protein [Catenuloplanes indicus]MDQ0366503.1 hypothetical protein [Catenuloplanes indicus]
MRFFQSESHSRPDDDKNDDTATDDGAAGTVRSEPVPVPRSSGENDVTDRVPDTDRDGHDDDSARRTGEPVDVDVIPDRRDDEEPVFVEPVPQETAFGAATVGGAVAASELAARRETDDPDTTATVRPASSDAFGTPVTTGDPAGFDGDAQAPHDFGRTADATDDDTTPSPDDTGHEHAAQSPHEYGRTGDDPAFATDDSGDTTDGAAQSPHEFGRAGEPAGSPSEFGRVHDDGTDADREGFGPADGRDTEPVEGFGPATGEAGTDKPLRAEGVTAAEGLGTADDPNRSSERLADEDRPEEEQTRSHAAETAALGVAAGAAAGAAVAGAAIRDRSAGHRDGDDHTGAAPTAKDRDGDGWPDAEPISNDRDGDGRIDGESAGAAGTAAVPIEPIPVPADARETPATVDEPVELLPGDVPEQPALAAFFSAGTAGDFRDRWREVQLRFVDDPAQAASDAGTLIDEVVAALNAAITQQREALGGSATGQGDTEQLRVLVRRQRDFLDRILGL